MLIFNNESLDYLIRTGKHCIHKDYLDYLKAEELKEMPKTKGNTDYKIGIIVPNYNNADWLEKCLNSILNQTYRNFEIIFIDDVSQDDSIKIAKRLLRKQDKIIELKQKRYNGGARNEGYLHLSKDVDYVYYVDSDDWLTDNYALELINQNLQGNPDVLFVGIGADYNGIMRSYYSPNYKNRYEAIQGWSGSCGKVIKKELAIKPECLYQEGTLKEDRTQHYKICAEMKTYRCLQGIVYIWNKNNTKSTTTIRGTKWKSDTIRNWADAVEMYENYKGKDIELDKLLLARIENCKKEVEEKGDSQL